MHMVHMVHMVHLVHLVHMMHMETGMDMGMDMGTGTAHNTPSCIPSPDPALAKLESDPAKALLDVLEECKDHQWKKHALGVSNTELWKEESLKAWRRGVLENSNGDEACAEAGLGVKHHFLTEVIKHMKADKTKVTVHEVRAPSYPCTFPMHSVRSRAPPVSFMLSPLSLGSPFRVGSHSPQILSRLPKSSTPLNEAARSRRSRSSPLYKLAFTVSHDHHP